MIKETQIEPGVLIVELDSKDLGVSPCQLCDVGWIDNENSAEDIASIKSAGRCTGCYEEWGDEYPDRV